MMPLSSDPCFTFRFAEDRLIPCFHLEGVEAGRQVSVFKIDPGTGERLGLLATATGGEGGWVGLTEPIIVRAGGWILSLLALGVFISFRIFAFPDITADGSITLGAAVAATLLVRGVDPWLATAAAFLAGMLAGATTGTLHTRFKIHGLLSGI